MSPPTPPSSTHAARHSVRGFVREFLASPRTVGAVAPSSRALARLMLRDLDLASARAVIEAGPGTGAFTAEILPRLGAGARFLAIEINPRMAEAWRARFPGRALHTGSITDAVAICAAEGITSPGAAPGESSVDCVISGLPWAAFPEPLQRQGLDAVRRVLRPGGAFVTFAYHVGAWLPAGRRFARLLPGCFSRVERTGSVLFNLPPAFVIRCTR